VANVVSANLLACKADEAAGEVFNIACGERYTILQLVETINKILGKNIKPVFDKERTGDVKHSLASIEKAKKDVRI
jgi:UDP-glucose 4-epimerase